MIFNKESLADLEGWWADSRGNLEIDVGCGKSDLVDTLADLNSDTRFLACDWDLSWCLKGSNRVRKRGLKNVRFVHFEAHELLVCWGRTNSVRCAYVLYPSPLPKSQRLVTEPFLLELYRTLEPGGELRLTTDAVDYYDSIVSSLGSEWEVLRWVPPFPNLKKGLLVGTPCERKYGTKYAIRARKRP